MNSDRWREIERLYHAARECEPEQRAALLEAGCFGDEELRREVESLLSKDDKDDSMLDRVLVKRASAVIPSGTELGAYRIEDPIGEGGMGVVYRAIDTRLNRAVAIKFLSGQLADRAARRRFQREAQTASSLNHPHIVTVHDVGEFDGTQYLVTEYLDGGTLRDWVQRPRPWRQVVEILMGVADAIATAHKANILHRDIKPENILLTRSSYAKLADFGLAKLSEPFQSSLDSTLTHARAVLGTPAYMSPEQASGEAVDRRSDIFSFGATLYEAVTGKRPFQGNVPAALRMPLEKALEKNPADRYQNMDDLVVDLRRTLRQNATGEMPDRARKPIGWIAAVTLVLLVALAGWLRPWKDHASERNVTLSLGPHRLSLVSPDGSAVLSNWVKGPVLRRLNSTEEIPLDFKGITDVPAWSPDGSEIVAATRDGLIRRPIPSGANTMVCPMIGPTRGLTWSPDGTILLAAYHEGVSGLYIVPAAGGTASHLEIPGMKDGEGDFFQPEFLPDGSGFLFVWLPAGEQEGGLYLARFEKSRVVRAPVLLRKNSTTCHFTTSGGGRLLFVQDDKLFAQKLDPRVEKLDGESQLVVSGVFSNPGRHEASFSVSRNGVLVWRAGRAELSQPTWFDRSGKVLGIAGSPDEVGSVRLSGDAQHILVLAGGRESAGIIDARQGGYMAAPGIRGALWVPHSSQILASDAKDGRRIVQRDAGGGDEREIARLPERPRVLFDLSSDGRVLLYRAGYFASYSVRLDSSPETRTPTSLFSTPATTNSARFSPDGKWFVYSIAERGKAPIYVQRFPPRGLRTQLAASGLMPVWRSDGREILFFGGSSIYSVPVRWASGEFHAGTPEALFRVRTTESFSSDAHLLDVTSDGAGILFAQGAEQLDPPVTYVMTSFDGMLKP